MTYKLTNTSINPDPYYGAVSLLLSGDGANNSTDIRDSSRNTKAISVAGNAKISTAQSKWNGSSLAFDGTNTTALTIPTSSDFDFGGGNFTVETWYYPVGAPQQYGRIFATRNGDVLGAVSLFHYLVEPRGIYLQMSADGSSALVDVAISPVLTASSWNHIALTRNGSSVTVFVNGSSVYSANIGSAVLYYNNADTICVGGQTSGISRSINGYLQDLRVTKGVARYTSNFTPPTQPFLPTFKVGADPEFFNTSLLLHGDGTNGSTNIVDSSYNTKTITVFGDAQISTAQSKFGGSSLAFDGSGDYLSAGDFADYDLSGVPFTVEAWIYPTSYASGANFNEARTVVGKWDNHGWRLQINTSSIVWYTGVTTKHSTAISLNQWTHIAVCGDGTTSSMYKNGVKVSGPSSDVFFNSINNKALIVGAALAGQYEFYFDGYIDDLRITKGVARYTSNFTPPTQPFPNF